jgi:hypothetical protein
MRVRISVTDSCSTSVNFTNSSLTFVFMVVFSFNGSFLYKTRG